MGVGGTGGGAGSEDNRQESEGEEQRIERSDRVMYTHVSAARAVPHSRTHTDSD